MDHRIRHFLERRDPSRYGLKDEEGETYKRHFGAAQLALPPPKAMKGREGALGAGKDADPD